MVGLTNHDLRGELRVRLNRAEQSVYVRIPKRASDQVGHDCSILRMSLSYDFARSKLTSITYTSAYIELNGDFF